LSSSDAVRHSRTTEPSPGTAEKDSSFTAVGTGAAKMNSWSVAVTLPQYWNSRMSVVIRLSRGKVV
jgi:hypothetical protein